jgi:hypothetical protein
MTYTEPWHCEMCDDPSSLCQCEDGPWNDIDQAFDFLKKERARLRSECGKAREALLGHAGGSVALACLNRALQKGGIDNG